MSEVAIPLRMQISEVEIHMQGLQAQINRDRRREIKRSPSQIEWLERRVAICTAIVETLRHVEVAP